jgi:ABC-2 type transport system permease protein
VAVSALDRRPIGYVDHSGVLENAVIPDGEDKPLVDFIAFPDEEIADAALRDEEIQAYYVFPEDYLENPQVDLYYLEETPDSVLREEFEDYVRYNLLPENPTPEQKLAANGFALVVRSADGNKEFDSDNGGIWSIFLPFGMMMLLLFVIMGGSGYFLQVVTDEKESRTMEVMITSVSPGQLIGGKSAALVAVGLTQIIVWIASALLALLIARITLSGSVSSGLSVPSLPWDMLLVIAIFFIPTYAIIAGLMISIGSVVAETQEGQQISGILNMLFTFPVFFAALAFADPDSPLLIALSLWPTTAMITIVMRWGLTVVPWWQIALAWVINVGTAAFVIWAASRIFRTGMLRYGQRISLKAAFGALLPK